MRKIKDWELWERVCAQVKSVKPITENEEREIYSTIASEEDSRVARQRLIDGYLWLVLKMSNQLFAEEYSNRDDIINSGILRLCWCADKFKVKKEKRFLDFASNSVRGIMWREIQRTDGMTPVPRLKKELEKRMKETISLSTVIGDGEGRSCELWEMIPDPNCVDVDKKIDQDRFKERFREEFDRLLRGMSFSKEMIVRSMGLFGLDRQSVATLSMMQSMSRQGVYKYINKGLEVLKGSMEMRELYNQL